MNSRPRNHLNGWSGTQEPSGGREPERVDAKKANGDSAYFALTCGAARLELVEGIKE